MHERVTVLSLSVSQSVSPSFSQSVIQSVSHSVSQSVSQSFCHTTKSGSRRWQPSKIETSIKMLHRTFKVPLVPDFFASTIYSETLVIFRPYNRKLLLVTPPIVMLYSHEQIISLLSAVVLHYTTSQRVYQSAWSFPLKLLVR